VKRKAATINLRLEPKLRDDFAKAVRAEADRLGLESNPAARLRALMREFIKAEVE
jgi:hypothetical protein